MPPLPNGANTAFNEYARTRGDFAAAAVRPSCSRRDHAAVAVLGTGSHPPRHRAPRPRSRRRSAEQAAALAAQVHDPHQRALVTELTRHALNEAGRA